ncbi:MAG TPA: hypothetical protein DHU63_09030 [Candidatus Marinimicrobia bacterium]|nr:MAG: hypothetical protein AUJ47_07350 [Candidatus Marinimicrobia bacterium CG1_02_48_14]PIZ67017.1 MAG: hypothetical protein COY19_06015 [Candidatus Marinimicrobia bacterium CG_4_10_14_0_2_um_filter_48_9]PJA51910.1 MAG: hypothetical protein CO167_11460 [Candidatus Marinimicrobia bacterium CG_4_9_14_3_um_filter_48_9]HCW76668.1 hypothetical protein [Candidatus Neomarinimicrobiota bacterium]
MSKLMANIFAFIAVLGILASCVVGIYQVLWVSVDELPVWGKVISIIFILALLAGFVVVIIDRIRSRKAEKMEAIKW